MNPFETGFHIERGSLFLLLLPHRKKEMNSDFVMGLFYGPGYFKKGETPLIVIDDHIRTKQMYAAGLAGINFLLSVLSLSISLVPGAALGGGPGGVVFATLPQTIWQIPVLVVTMMALLSVYFDSNNNMPSTASWLMVSFWFMCMLVVVNIISAVSLILGVNNVNSTLWLQNGGKRGGEIFQKDFFYFFAQVHGPLSCSS